MLSILLPALAAMRLPAAPRAPQAVQASFGALTTAFSMPFAADAVELYRDAATAEDLGTRPVIAGVPAGVIYFALALCVQAGIFLQGRQSTMFMKSMCEFNNLRSRCGVCGSIEKSGAHAASTSFQRNFQ